MNIRKLSKFFSVSLILWFFIASISTEAAVKVDGGLVEGVKADGLTVYKGIPFAAPSVGGLRWKAPQPVVPWKGVLKADSFAPGCPQPPFPNSSSMVNYIKEMSEDCLYLNVWTPAKKPDEALPVMVWIHGGGFAIGATSIPNYEGSNLAKKGVVLVSIAYRVGVLGFLSHPELSAENDRGISGNYGLMDQLAGLRWVQDNIAAFGGDPDNVTIFGESAGGMSVSMLCASPQAKGLFQRAICESGGNLGPVLEQHTPGFVQTQKGAEAFGLAYSERMGAASIEELRALPAEQLLQDEQTAYMGGFWPICDGFVITGDQYKLYEKGEYNDVDLLIGTNSNEGAIFVRESSVEQLKAQVQQNYYPLGDEALEVYPATDDATALQSARDIFRDSTFAWSSWAWARLQHKTGDSDVYVYYFDQPQPPRVQGESLPNAAHADEINYVFGHVDENFNFQYTDDDRALSSLMMDYWVNFARNGNPNGEELPHWPLFQEGDQDVIYLKGGQPTLGPVANLKQLQFFERFYKMVREHQE